MNGLSTFIIVYLVYGCLMAINLDSEKSKYIKDHPYLGTCVVIFLWGFIFTFLLLCITAANLLGVKKNETNRVSELKAKDKED